MFSLPYPVCTFINVSSSLLFLLSAVVDLYCYSHLPSFPFSINLFHHILQTLPPRNHLHPFLATVCLALNLNRHPVNWNDILPLFYSSSSYESKSKMKGKNVWKRNYVRHVLVFGILILLSILVLTFFDSIPVESFGDWVAPFLFDPYSLDRRFCEWKRKRKRRMDAVWRMKEQSRIILVWEDGSKWEMSDGCEESREE